MLVLLYTMKRDPRSLIIAVAMLFLNTKPFLPRSYLSASFRLESYSVDMMLHKLDRVNKLGAEILSMEETLLDVSDIIHYVLYGHFTLCTLIRSSRRWKMVFSTDGML